MMIESEKLAELLNGPFGCRMRGDVRVQNPARTDFHCDKDVHDSERCGYGNKEITRNNCARVVSDKSAPALIPRSISWPISIEILANRSWRNPDSEFEQKFIGNLPFAPSRILT